MRITQRFGKENTAPDLLKLYANYGLIGHNGVDIVFPDKKIYSPVDGKVIYLAPDYSDGYGAFVKILDALYNFHYFCHLDTWSDALQAGHVKQGQLIGIMGGSSLGERYHFGAHLHYGIKPVRFKKTGGYRSAESNGYRGYIDPETVVDLSLLEGLQT